MTKRDIKKSAVCAAFAAAICVLSPFAIPTGSVPITLATFGVYVAALCLPCGESVIAVALYLAIGAAGAPVFSGFSGGAARLLSPTGGYLLGYLPCAAITSALAALWRRRAKRRGADLALRSLAAICGTVVLYAIGTAWFAVSQETSPAAAISVCVLPFLPGDAAKIVCAAIVSRALAPVLEKVSGR